MSGKHTIDLHTEMDIIDGMFRELLQRLEDKLYILDFKISKDTIVLRSIVEALKLMLSYMAITIHYPVEMVALLNAFVDQENIHKLIKRINEFNEELSPEVKAVLNSKPIDPDKNK